MASTKSVPVTMLSGFLGAGRRFSVFFIDCICMCMHEESMRREGPMAARGDRVSTRAGHHGTRQDVTLRLLTSRMHNVEYLSPFDTPPSPSGRQDLALEVCAAEQRPQGGLHRQRCGSSEHRRQAHSRRCCPRPQQHHRRPHGHHRARQRMCL